jgi:PTS system mannose-specific IID component
MAETRLHWPVLLSVFWRSFFLQSSWNFERLQNLGFLFLMLPGLRVLYGKVPPEVLKRYSSYFNTHPSLAPLVAGTTLRLEARKQAGEETPVDADDFKKMVMAPYAAMGDALFWGAIRPLASIISLLLAVQGSLWAPVVFLLMYNLPHFFCRGGGMVLGYVQELRAIETIQRLKLADLAVRIKEACIVLLGVLCAYLAYKGCDHQEIPSVWGFSLLPVVLLFAWLAHKGVSSLFLVLVTTASLLSIALIF